MEQYWNWCSYGKVTWTKDNNLIVGPIDIPCNHTWSQGTFDMSKCGYNQLYGWMEYAQNWTLAVRGEGGREGGASMWRLR